LFESQGWDCSFLREEVEGLYPNTDDLSQNEPAGIPLCPNPWTTLFVVENGDAHLCFLSEPVGSLYEMPLASIWNSQRALAKRSDMIFGRCLKSGCSARWCSWREGKPAAPGGSAGIRALQEEIKQLAGRATGMRRLVQIGETPSGIAAVRRMVSARDRQIRELEAMFAQVCDKNAAVHKKGQEYIDTLEARLADMQTKEREQSSAFDKLDWEYQHLKRTFAVRAAGRLSRLFSSKRLAC
jgi:hypothetical protein